MPRHQLRADLAGVRFLIAAGRTQLDRQAGHQQDYWLDSARHRLGELDMLLIAATARMTDWVRAALAAVIAFVGVLAVAAGARAIGLPGGGTIACAILAMIVLSPMIIRLTNRLEWYLESRRVRSARPDAVVPAAPGRLTEVPESLLLARTRLVSAILRQVRPADRRVPILTRRMTSEFTLIFLQDADLLLCQALDQLETHLEERRR